MSFLALVRFAVGASAAAASLAACGATAPPTGGYGANAAKLDFSHDLVFKYTGHKQSFKVPAGVTMVTITADGADGAPGGNDLSGYFAARGGGGGSVTATIRVTPGERLAIFVGGSGLRGGFNGGGWSHYSVRKSHYGYGGGASDVRQGGDKLSDRVLVAAGGGGGGVDGYGCSTRRRCTVLYAGAGGRGGGTTGYSGEAASGPQAGSGGAGGTQSAGGAGGTGGGGSGCGGSSGELGAGGNSGFGTSSGCGAAGGGGGGGYYGGGAGGSGGMQSSYDYGGGGGSSYAESNATHVSIREAARKSDGSIVILW